MKLSQITLTMSEDGHIEVSATGHRSGPLCSDEALGCVASWLYAPTDIPRYMESDLTHARHRRRYGLTLDERGILALRTAGEPVECCGACKGRGDVQTDGGTFLVGDWQTCAACCGKGWVG